MIWFEYKYTTSSDIINNIKLLTEYSIIEYAILTISLILLILIIYYIIPTINIYFWFAKKENEQLKRKVMIKQIVMQKDINNEIEKELNIS